jgi:hypothetical protein
MKQRVKVLYSKDVEEYLRELIEILYGKGYFGFKEAAYQYVDTLVDEIDATISIKPSKSAPEYFSKYGKELLYVAFPKNRNTTWYVFFNVEDGVYFIRYIGNNHVISQYL